MKDTLFISLMFFGGIIVFIMLMFPFYYFGQKSCENKFGNGWDFRLSWYGPDMCVNNNGEVKVL